MANGVRTTAFTFFKNTPLIDMENTIHFKNNAERDTFFFSDVYEKIDVSTIGYNFVRDRSSVVLQINYNDCYGINYVTWKTEGDSVRYYAKVINYEYINEEQTRLNFLIDGVMTFCQGNFTESITNVLVDRQHIPKSWYKSYEMQLRTNTDVLATGTKEYIQSDVFYFDKLGVIFQCSIDLEDSFGTEDNPKLHTSKGGVYDGIVSPVSLYYISYDNWLDFNTKMKKYPWITQNFQKIMMVPDVLIDSGDLQKADMSKNIKYDNLKKFKNKGGSKSFDLKKLNRDIANLLELFDIGENETYLFRSEYCSIEMNDYSGQQVAIEPQYLPDKGLEFTGQNAIGYHNEISVYPIEYMSRKETGDVGTADTNMKGTNLNLAIHINAFDEVPMLVDNYKLSLAQSANQRQLAESKLLSKRVDNVLNGSGNNGMQGRLMDAANLLSNVSFNAFGTIGSIFGQATSEYEFYRSQKAEFADKAISAPSITAQSNNNAFQIANNIYGIWVKYSSIDISEWNKVRRYHGLFGFEFNQQMRLASCESMDMLNFVKFAGNWKIKDCDPAIFALIKAQFENGVKLWHNTGKANPFTQDPTANKWR